MQVRGLKTKILFMVNTPLPLPALIEEHFFQPGMLFHHLFSLERIPLTSHPWNPLTGTPQLRPWGSSSLHWHHLCEAVSKFWVVTSLSRLFYWPSPLYITLLRVFPSGNTSFGFCGVTLALHLLWSPLPPLCSLFLKVGVPAGSILSQLVSLHRAPERWHPFPLWQLVLLCSGRVSS